jgi:hypothetical protein
MKKLFFLSMISITALNAMELYKPCSGALNPENLCSPSPFRVFDRNRMNEYAKQHALSQEEAILDAIKKIPIVPGQRVLNIQSGHSITTYLAQKVKQPEASLHEGLVMFLDAFNAEKDGALPRDTFDHIVFFAASWGVLSQQLIINMKNALNRTGQLHIACNGYASPVEMNPDFTQIERNTCVASNIRVLKKHLTTNGFSIDKEELSIEKCVFDNLDAFKGYIKHWMRGECAEIADGYLARLCDITAQTYENKVTYHAPRILMHASKKN